MKIKIYSGLSIDQKTIRKIIPEAICAGPIQRNDLLRDMDDGIHVVGIIDGQFYHNLAIPPAEILDALRFGMKIYGSSSMGAMRAVELSDYGMIGSGRIFNYILNHPYFNDDHLGQVFSENSSIQNLALIDFKLGLVDAVKKRKILSSTADRVLKTYMNWHFSERSLGRLVKQLDTMKMSHSEKKKIILLVKNFRSIKQLDAIGLLNLMARTYGIA